MSASCHLERVALYTHGKVDSSGAPEAPLPHMSTHLPTHVPTHPLPVQRVAAVECCEYCEAPTLSWRKCKQICLSCGQINRSCAAL